MTARLRGLAGATVVSLAGLLTAAGAAFAATPAAVSPDQVQTVRVGQDDAEVLPIQVDHLHPGAATSARFLIERGSRFDGGHYSLAVEQLEDLERGCNSPEQRAGDTTCEGGTDQGELSRQLLVGAAWSAAAQCASAPLPTSGRPLAEVADEVQSAPDAMSEDEAVCLVLALDLPFEADNLVQSDLVRFDLRLGLSDARPSTQVLGGADERPLAAAAPGAAPPAALGAVPDRLPFSGTWTVAVALWALVCAALGWVLLVAARPPRSRRRRPGPITRSG